MNKVEKKLQLAVLENCAKAEAQYDCKMTRLVQTIERFGVAKTAQEMIRKRRTSDGFAKLASAGRLDLTLEAQVVKSEYGELFSDEEVNECYDLLCEHGYY